MFQAVRGMQDILPTITTQWQQLEYHLKNLAHRYGYQEIRLPIIEKTALFHRLGEITDIVEKEMYTFADSKDQALSLRPEATVGCVRAVIEHGLLKDPTQRLWYLGPMFRRERPQKGRYRQFHQFGAEAFGMIGPDIEAELISMSSRLFQTLGLEGQLRLEVNSLGNLDTRRQYRTKLVHYFNRYQQDLDEDSKRRLLTNPLRILDSKNPSIQDLIANAPQLSHYLDSESEQHFQIFQDLLRTLNIPFKLNPRLVRGLDYYNKTVFEWVLQDMLGSQNTVCAGGRYDGLVEQLTGPKMPAAGFAIGLERLIQLWIETHPTTPYTLDAYFILADQAARIQGLVLAEMLRTALPTLKLQVDSLGGRFATQFKRADKSGARFALVLGDDELNSHTITIKALRTTEVQRKVSHSECISYLQNALDSG